MADLPLHTEFFPRVSASRVEQLLGSRIFEVETRLLGRIMSGQPIHLSRVWPKLILSLCHRRRSEGFDDSVHRVARMVHAGLMQLDRNS